MTKLVKCNCKHAVQDEMYGYGNRMANETRSGQLRCTVCGILIGSAQTITQKAAVIKEAVKEVKKEETKKEVKKEVKKESNKDLKIKAPEKKEKKGSMKGGKR